MSSLGEILQQRTPNVNVNPSSSTSNNVNVKSISSVQEIAHRLCEQLSDEHDFEYFCKVAWKLPESVIWSNVEAALKGRNKARLFTWLCSQSMKKVPASR